MGESGTTARRARERRERRGAILDAAATVFSERGATNATMDEVAEAACVSKGTLYLYFKSKDDLFVALTLRPLDAVLARFERLTADAELAGATLLRRLLDAHAEVVDAHATHFRLGIASLCGGFEPDPGTPSLRDYADRVQTLRATYIAAVERGREDGTLRPDLVPHQVAAALWAGMFGATFLRMNAARFAARLPERAERVDFDGMVPALADLLMEGVRARGASA